MSNLVSRGTVTLNLDEIAGIWREDITVLGVQFKGCHKPQFIYFLDSERVEGLCAEVREVVARTNGSSKQEQED